MSFKRKLKTIRSLFYPSFFYFYKKQETNYSCPICKFHNKQIKILEIESSEIILCKNCNNAWTSPIPECTDYENEDFQSQFDFQNINEIPLQWRNSLLKQINTIRTKINSRENILEIGCSQGFFLNDLRKNGFNVLGLEPSITGAKRASDKGLEIINDFFPSRELKDRKFDLIYLSHVLEHIYDINTFLDEIIKILAKNGRVFFIQTHFKGIMPRIEKSKWHGWAISQHLWHFTPLGLSYILKQKGFEIEKLNILA